MRFCNRQMYRHFLLFLALAAFKAASIHLNLISIMRLQVLWFVGRLVLERIVIIGDDIGTIHEIQFTKFENLLVAVLDLTIIRICDFLALCSIGLEIIVSLLFFGLLWLFLWHPTFFWVLIEFILHLCNNLNPILCRLHTFLILLARFFTLYLQLLGLLSFWLISWYLLIVRAVNGVVFDFIEFERVIRWKCVRQLIRLDCELTCWGLHRSVFGMRSF
jgi:hypothetical protein